MSQTVEIIVDPNIIEVNVSEGVAWDNINNKPAVIAAGATIQEALEQIGLENVNAEILALQEEQITQNEAIDLKADKVNLPPTPSNVLDVNVILRRGNVISNIIDQYTGEPITATKVTGTPTGDNIIYFQIGSEYFKRNLINNTINIKWFGAIGNGVNNDAIAINKALDIASTLGGITVVIDKPTDKYLIGTSLLIGSNTTLLIDQSAEIYLANAVNNVIIGNKNKTTVGAPTIIDENITIIGGIWNGNRLNQSKWSGTPEASNPVTLNLFSGVRNLKILGGKYINSRTYAHLYSNIDTLEVDGCNVDIYTGIQDNGDGIHLLGLISNYRITNCIIKSDDNFIAVNADDISHGPHGLFGKVENGYINNITVNNNDKGQGMRLLSGVSPIKTLTVSNIKGSAAYFFVASTLNIGVGDFDDITFENISLEYKPSLWNYVEMTGNFGDVTFNNIHIKSDPTVLATKSVDRYFYIFSQAGGNTKFKKLTANNILVSNLNTTTPSIRIFLLNNNVNIESLNINNLTSKDNLKPTKIIGLSDSFITRLYTSNMDIDYANNGLLLVEGSSVVTKHFIDGTAIETFTPTIKGSTTAGVGTYTVQKGLFSIGNGIVNFEIDITWTAHTGTGQIVIDLPKGVKTTSIDYSPCNIYKTGLGLISGESPRALIYRAGSRVQIYKETFNSITAISITATGALLLSGFYYLNTSS